MTTVNNTPETDFRKTVAEISEMTERALEAGDSDMLRLLCSKAHELAIEARNLYRGPEDSDSAEWLCAELRVQGFSCERHVDAIWITLPLLLPKRGGDVRFITEPLEKLLSIETGHKRFRDATIVYIQTYDRRKKVSVIGYLHIR